ncbi:uncharacterized protein RB166_017015 [Leptodactylus fuscus]|uniref:uncharacterized protein LOC142218359 n=1 Tax=Leptodactylus fuscus TaxID=238119 RepID=UPI003F4E9B01
MAEEQPPVLQETPKEESPQLSEPEVQESPTSPEETSAEEEKTKECTTPGNGLDEEQRTEEQTGEEKGDTNKEEKGDSKVKEEEKGDSKVKEEEKGDSKVKEEQKGDSKVKEEEGDTKVKEEEKGDSKVKEEEKGDSKVKEEEKGDSKVKEEEKGDSKVKEEEKGDSKVKEEEKGDSKVKEEEEKGDSKVKEEEKGDSKVKEEEKGDSKVKEEEEKGDSKVKEEEKGEGGDAGTSSGDLKEASVTSDGEKAGTGTKEEISSTQGEGGDDLSSHKSKPEDVANSQEVPAATEGEKRSKEKRTQPSAKDSTDKVDKSKPAASSAKAGVAATTSKEAAHDKERDKKSEIPRARTMPKSYGRATKKDIAEKFGGVATSGIRVQRSTSCGAGAVKNMLLQWCQAKTRGREGVEIENFSSSWSSGLAFCALILAFFPDAFDYDSLDPKNRRENFQLAFNAAEKYADCPPLLDVEDMVRMKVPDSKCVYTYVQELYRSLVAKGLVKTKKA